MVLKRSFTTGKRMIKKCKIKETIMKENIKSKRQGPKQIYSEYCHLTIRSVQVQRGFR